MAQTLSDEAWAAFLAAAKPHTPDADARAALSKVLFEDYPGYAYDPARARAAAERMLKNLDAFAELYGETNHISADNLKAILEDRAEAFIPNRAEAFIPNDIENQRALWCIARLRRRTKAMLHAARTLQDAKTPRQTEQRAMLYHWLCGVWLYHFGGELTYDRSGGDLGGEPGGPLVDFILTAMRQVMPEDALPSREAARDNIDRERGRREVARRLWLQQQQRNRGVGD